MIRAFRSGISRRPEYVALGAIVAIAIWLRLPALLHAGLWRDQANVYVEVIAPNFQTFLARTIAMDWHPPLYFTIAYVWARIAGTSELAMLVLPFIFSIATVPVTYELGKNASRSRTAGLFAAAIYALAPIGIDYATQYVYPLFALLTTLLAYVTLRARNEGLTTGRYVAIALVTLLIAFTHYLALFYVAVLIVWILAGAGALRTKLALASALVLGALPFIFWLPVMLQQHAIGAPYGEPTSSLGRAEHVVLMLALLAIAAFIKRFGLFGRDALWLVAIFLGVLTCMSAADILADHYIAPFCCLVYAFFGDAIDRIVETARAESPSTWRRWGLPATAFIFAVAVVADATNVRANNERPESGIRTIAATHAFDPKALYVLDPDYLAPTFVFYARSARVSFTGFARADHPEIFALGGYAAIWNQPNVVAKAIDAIDARARNYTSVDFVVDDYSQDLGHMPYGKAWEMLRTFGTRHRLLGRKRYPGYWESVTVYRFDASAENGRPSR